MKNPFFDLQKAFRTFDKTNRGLISKHDVGRVLEENGHPLTPLQLNLIFSKFNR